MSQRSSGAAVQEASGKERRGSTWTRHRARFRESPRWSGLLTARRSRISAALLGIILAIGFGLRIANLDGSDFNIDEVLHAFAARELLQGDEAALPSGVPYGRALLYTRVVALAGRFGGVDEWTARLPSVLFGSLTIVVIYLMGRTWYSDAAGLVAASIAAVAPMQIAFSREGRMYAMFQFCHLLFLFSLFLAFEGAPKRTAGSRWPAGRRWAETLGVWPLMFVVAAAALVLAKQLHNLVVLGVLGPAAYVAAMAVVASLFTTGLRPGKYVLGSVAFLLGAVTYAVATDAVPGYAWLSTYTPEWAVNNTGRGYYLRTLANSYPLILPGLLAAGGIALTQNTRATVYLLCSFGVPLVLQSLFFAWKHERYIFYVVPLMFIVFGVGASTVTALLYRALREWASAGLRPWIARLTAGALTAGAVLFLLAFMPWFRDGLTVHRHSSGTVAGVYHHNWRAAAQFVAARRESSEAVIASAPALALYYGLPAPLYYLANDTTDRHLEAGLRDEEGRALDYIAGAPMILDRRTLEQVIGRYPSGWIISERFRFQSSRPLPDDIRSFIELQCEQQVVPDAPTMIVWRWRRTQ